MRLKSCKHHHKDFSPVTVFFRIRSKKGFFIWYLKEVFTRDLISAIQKIRIFAGIKFCEFRDLSVF